MSGNRNKEDAKQQSMSSQPSSATIISTSSSLSTQPPTYVMTDVSAAPVAASNLSQTATLSDSALTNPQQYMGGGGGGPRNGSTRRGLVHSVSIIVEPAMADGDDDDGFGPERPSMPSVSTERRNTIAGPIVLLEDYPFEPPRKAREEDDIVQSIIAHARLRKEEFARLLEEHAQIVNEINRAETSLL